MSKVQKAPTLRQYLDELNSIKRVKSLQNIHNPQTHHKSQKSTEQLQKQIDDKISDIRKSLSNKNNIHREYDLLQYIYELNNIVSHVFQKLKRLQGKGQLNKNINTISQNNVPQLKIQPIKIPATENNLKPEPSRQIKVDQLLTPHAMSKQIKFSTDGLSNIGTSTTGDFSPLRNTVQKIQSIEQPMNKNQKNSRKSILKTVKSVQTLPIQKYTRNMIQSSGSYKIKVSICQSDKIQK